MGVIFGAQSSPKVYEYAPECLCERVFGVKARKNRTENQKRISKQKQPASPT